MATKRAAWVTAFVIATDAAFGLGVGAAALLTASKYAPVDVGRSEIEAPSTGAKAKMERMLEDGRCWSGGPAPALPTRVWYTGSDGLALGGEREVGHAFEQLSFDGVPGFEPSATLDAVDHGMQIKAFCR